jgi:filamentous hemagglutinin
VEPADPGLLASTTSIVLDILPGVGAAKSVGQLITGYDLVTGEKVNRWGEAGGIVLGLIPGGKILSKFGDIGLLGSRALRASDKALTSIDDLAEAALRADALKAGEVAAERGAAFAEIGTPWGSALQSSVPEAMAARSSVENGANLYRLGTVGRSEAAEAQFWALEHPLNPGYAARHGIPPSNVAKFDFIETATLKPGTPFVTRPAPGIGTNPGGGIEVVVPNNGVTMKYFGGH